MIDTHAHILPNLDDGAKTLEHTKRLLEKAMDEQLTGIIATPHAFHPNFQTNIQALYKQLDIVNNYILNEQLPLKIYSGQECRLNDKIVDKLDAEEALTLAESRYVLLELPSVNIPVYTIRIIQQLVTQNYVPIIAHAERNQSIIQKPERLKKLLQHGAMAQVTSGSLSGSFGKAIQRTAMNLIDANLIHVYGSDVHNLDTRPFHFNEGLEYLKKKKKHNMVDILLENNERIILDEQLYVLEPESTPKGKWWDMFTNK